MQVMHHLCLKNTLPSKRNYVQPFTVELQKILIKTTHSEPLSKQSRLWFHQSKLLLFVPFCSHQS